MSSRTLRPGVPGGSSLSQRLRDGKVTLDTGPGARQSQGLSPGLALPARAVCAGHKAVSARYSLGAQRGQTTPQEETAQHPPPRSPQAASQGGAVGTGWAQCWTRFPQAAPRPSAVSLANSPAHCLAPVSLGAPGRSGSAAPNSMDQLSQPGGASARQARRTPSQDPAAPQRHPPRQTRPPGRWTPEGTEERNLQRGKAYLNLPV